MNTPVLQLDLQKVEANFQALQNALPDFRIAYAIKANPHEKIIEVLNRNGGQFETASWFEIAYLEELGIDPAKIVFSNPIKTEEAVGLAVSRGITLQSFDSVEELAKFLPHRDTIRPLFRIYVPNTGSIWPLSQKFGCPEEYWDEVFAAMRDQGIPLAGFTFHVGSQCESLEGWHTAMELTWKALQRSRKFGLNPDTLNIGGGFPIYLGREIPDVREIADVIYSWLNRFKADGWDIRELIAEPGRFISGPAGTLASKVIGVAKRSEKKIVYLDCGIFSGMMEAIDGLTYPLMSSGQGDPEKVTLSGPSCDSLDTMFETVIPKPKYGDIILFSGAGAYTTVYASKFNGFPAPEVELINADVTEAV